MIVLPVTVRVPCKGPATNAGRGAAEVCTGAPAAGAGEDGEVAAAADGADAALLIRTEGPQKKFKRRFLAGSFCYRMDRRCTNVNDGVQKVTSILSFIWLVARLEWLVSNHHLLSLSCPQMKVKDRVFLVTGKARPLSFILRCAAIDAQVV